MMSLKKNLEQEKLQKLTEYLTEHPAALEAASYAYEQIASEKVEENIHELFAHLDPEALGEIGPKFAHYIELKEIHESLAKGELGSIAGFLYFLQLHHASGGNIEDYLKPGEFEI